MLAFIHIHKTGGQTVEHILASTFGVHFCLVEPWQAPPGDFGPSDLLRLQRFYPRLESIAGHYIRPYIDLGDIETKYFTLMRDPIRRTASNFQFAVQELGRKDRTFEEWLQDEFHHNRQTQMIAGTADVNQAIEILKEKEVFVGLTERFDESMLMLKTLVANELNISYERVNVARRNELAHDLLSTPRTRQMIMEVNQVDLELYNHVTQNLYPTFQSAYGNRLEADVAQYRENRGTFNRRNLMLRRFKRYMLYKPLLYLYRRGFSVIRKESR